MDTAQLAFDIVVSIQSNTSASAEILHLGPTEPFSSTPDGQVNVQLLGDLSSYNSMPDFSSYYLMIPSPSGVLTGSFLTDGEGPNDKSILPEQHTSVYASAKRRILAAQVLHAMEQIWCVSPSS